MTPAPDRRFGIAWLALTAALALHVTDEALTDFLGFYNPFIMMLRDVLLIEWLPTFKFVPWLVGLIAAIALLALASRWAFQCARWTLWAAIPYSILMLFNGLAHIGMSVYTQRMIPGTWSAPLLVIFGLNLLVRAFATLRA